MVVKREKLLSNTQYRWEFLKRDPNYIQTYDKYRKSSPKKRVEWEFVIKNKFGLISPLDPYDKSLFNESYFEDDFKNVVCIQDEPEIYFDDYGNSFVDEVDTKKLRYLDLQIDLHTKTDEIIKNTKYLVLIWKKRIKRRRSRPIEYGKYLKAYDLSLKGWKPEKIAKKMHKNYENNPENALRKTYKYLKSAKKLIDGGYRKIR